MLSLLLFFITSFSSLHAYKPFIVGHRGACGYAPENTLISFKKALELGVDVIEFDVHLCKTGEVVVIHDRWVDRTTNGKGRVVDMTLQQLRALSIKNNQKISVLTEVIDLIQDKALINIELKGFGTGKKVAEILKKYIDSKKYKPLQFVVASFNQYELKSFKKHESRVPTGVILYGLPLDIESTIDALRPEYVGLGYDFLTKSLVERVHKKSCKIMTYVLNHEADIKHALQLKVDGIISDCPDKVQRLLPKSSS